MSSNALVLGVPSKGRLMEQAAALFKDAGLAIRKTGHERGYRGAIDGRDDVEVAYLSASEVASHLARGRVHIGVTGEDLVREAIPEAESKVDFTAPLGFGFADVVVAVPGCWLDVSRMADLEEVAAQYYRTHDRRLRVATKYMNLTRRFFAEHGVTSYRIVESLGATEGTPAAGTADIIVDITTTGTTLKANHLKLVTDGTILKSQAMLMVSKTAAWTDEIEATRDEIVQLIEKAGRGKSAGTGSRKK